MIDRRVVEVNELDFIEGKMGKCRECPVARAVKRAFEDTRLTDIEVAGPKSQHWIMGRMDNTRYCANLPAYVEAFITRFDLDVTFTPKPFSFEIQFHEFTGGLL